MDKQQAQKIFELLKKHYPRAKMILQWSNNFELLVSIILSAQCTDKKVNEVTSVVFPKYRKERKEFAKDYAKYTRINLPKQKKNKDSDLTREELIEIVNFADVPITELESDIHATGFYHAKAKSVKGAAQTILEKFQGILPRSISELTTIPGVGRKTANVFLGNAYHIYEGIAVDTHVMKQSQLLGLTKQKDPVKIEKDLMNLFSQKDWFALTYVLIEHGRNMRRKKSDRLSCGNPSCPLGDII